MGRKGGALLEEVDDHCKAVRSLQEVWPTYGSGAGSLLKKFNVCEYGMAKEAQKGLDDERSGGGRWRGASRDEDQIFGFRRQSSVDPALYLSTVSVGCWVEDILHSFHGTDGTV